MQEKDIWRLLEDCNKVTYADGPWGLLLTWFGIERTAPQILGPCPCVWRRPPSGPQPDGLARELRWDWLSATTERAVRLALQHRAQVREAP